MQHNPSLILHNQHIDISLRYHYQAYKHNMSYLQSSDSVTSTRDCSSQQVVRVVFPCWLSVVLCYFCLSHYISFCVSLCSLRYSPGAGPGLAGLSEETEDNP